MNDVIDMAMLAALEALVSVLGLVAIQEVELWIARRRMRRIFAAVSVLAAALDQRNRGRQ